MLTKTCKNCGWVLPATHASRRCPVCKELINQGVCKKCGKYADVLHKGFYCDDCYRVITHEADRKKRKRRAERHAKTFNDWMDKVRKVPKSYPTLTEAQWLKACKHFNGCAFCGSDTIDTRAYFIKFKDGGRYCDWNVLPACERCAMSTKGINNPFLPLAGNNVYATPILNKVKEYLEDILDDAITEYHNHDDT